MPEADEIVEYVPYREIEGGAFSPKIRAALERLDVEVTGRARLEGVLDLLWEATESILPRDRIGLSFLEEEEEERLVARYARADYEPLLLGEGYAAQMKGSSLEPLMRTRTLRILHDLRAYLEDVNPDSASTRVLVREGVRSSLTVPLRAEGRPVGFLFFSSREAGRYTAEHGRILLSVLDRVAQAIEKGWVISRLREAKEGCVSMLGFVSHEMKSPLSALVTRGKTYLRGYLGEVDPPAEKVVSAMVRQAEQLLGMVGDYLDLARLEGGEMRVRLRRDVRLVEEVLREALEGVRPHANERNTALVEDLPEEDVLLEADPNLLRIVFANLLDNGIKYGFENGEVTLCVTPQPERVVVRVRNRGVGFSPEQAEKLFKRFSRLRQEGVEDRRGTGLGLYLTALLVEKHGGTIRAESEPGAWAAFEVCLPRQDAPGAPSSEASEAS